MNNQICDITKTAEFAEERLVASAQSLLEETLFDKGCSKADLAAAMGVSKARVSQIFSSNQNFTLRMLARAFHALGVTVELSVPRALEVKSQPTDCSLFHSFDYLEAFAWTDGESHGQPIQLSEGPALSGDLGREIARSLRKTYDETSGSDESDWRSPAEEWGANVIPLRRKAGTHV